MQALLDNPVNEVGNMLGRGVVPKFSDLEMLVLSLTAGSLSIDSENFLSAELNKHRDFIPDLISRSQFNTRRKLTISVCNTIQERIRFGDWKIVTIVGKKGIDRKHKQTGQAFYSQRHLFLFIVRRLHPQHTNPGQPQTLKTCELFLPKTNILLIFA